MKRLLFTLLLAASASNSGVLFYPQEPVAAVRTLRSAYLDNSVSAVGGRWTVPGTRTPLFAPTSVRYVVTDNRYADLRAFSVGDTLLAPGNGDPDITAAWAVRAAKAGVVGAFYRDYGDLRGLSRVDDTPLPAATGRSR